VEGPSSEGKDAAEAFVVAVAYPLHCASNATGKELAYNDSVTMKCSITFMGQHRPNLTLEWLNPDDTVVKSQDFWSDDKGHVARLDLTVSVLTSRYNVSMPEYKCRASFGNRTTGYRDRASNPPEFPPNTNTCPVPAPTKSSTNADDGDIVMKVEIVLGVTGILLLAVIVLLVYKTLYGCV